MRVLSTPAVRIFFQIVCHGLVRGERVSSSALEMRIMVMVIDLQTVIVWLR